MNSHLLKVIALGVSLAAAAGSSAAAQQAEASQSAAGILQFQHALRAKLDAPSDEYSHFDAKSIHTVENAQDKVFRILAGVTSLDQLNADQRVEVTNAVEEVKAVMLANEGNRIICHREKKIGSNMVERRCESVAGREARTHQADQFMSHDRLNTPSSNGGG